MGDGVTEFEYSVACPCMLIAVNVTNVRGIFFSAIHDHGHARNNSFNLVFWLIAFHRLEFRLRREVKI